MVSITLLVMRKSTIFIGILVILGIALYASGHVNAEQSNVIQVNLEDSLTMTDSVETTINSSTVTGAECWKRYLYNQPCTIISQLFVSPNIETSNPLIGKIVSSKDGTTCWKVEEKIGVYYYKLIGDCPNA